VKRVLSSPVVKTNYCINAAIYGSLASIATDLWNSRKQVQGRSLTYLHYLASCAGKLVMKS